MSVFDFRDLVSTWTHLLWAVLSVPATVLLWRRTRGDRPRQLTMLVYGLSMTVCFGLSALFHAVRLAPERIELFARLDYVGIFLLIAGTGTPIVFTLCRGPYRWGTLGGVWLMAAAGIGIRLADLDVPRAASTLLYLGMGWGLGSCYPELRRVVPPRQLRLVLLGGMLYSVGAFIYLARWPEPWPGVFASHEIFHLFGMAASLSFFCFIVKYVVPYQRVRGPQPDAAVRRGPLKTSGTVAMPQR